MINENVALIGGGNMAMAIVRGLTTSGYSPENITVSDPSSEQLQALSSQLKVKTTSHNDEAVADAGVIIFAIKPQIFNAVATALAATISPSQLIISVAAGIETGSIEQWIADKQPVIRAMPNTPALINQGITGLFANTFVSESQKKQAECLLKSIGETLWFDKESLMDSVTAVSGSGPAYFFRFIECLLLAAEKTGLSETQAKQLVTKTAAGAIAMVLESDEPVGRLRERVTSPGGTTAAALEVIEQHNLLKILEQAVDAAKKRGQSLSKEFGC